MPDPGRNLPINGHTKIIGHLGYPTGSFRAPMIYNPYFAREGIDALVVPLGCKAPEFPEFLKLFARLSNAHGALITMPHKVTVLDLLDEVSPTARIAGACNAVRFEGGRLIGDMFDGEGFSRGVLRKGRAIAGASVLVVGSGGVGSAIAASMAKAGAARLGLYDAHPPSAEALGQRLAAHHPDLKVTLGSNDPAGFDIVVNATPLGMKPDDPLPVDVARLSRQSFVGEVVMSQKITPLLAAARSRGCAYQVGVDMLFEQIPAYLEFFGFPSTTAEDLRGVAQVGSFA